MQMQLILVKSGIYYKQQFGVIVGAKTGFAFRESRKINILCCFLINFILLLEIRQISLTIISYDIYILRK